jgi:HAD superfamily hydrolase (TIGR01509 family)
MITHVICDLGAVLVHLRWREHASAILGRDTDHAELHRIWTGFTSIRELETGNIDVDTFVERFHAEVDSPLSQAELRRHFIAIVGPPFTDAVAVIDRLRRQYTVSILSNTNPPHIEQVRRDSDILDHVDFCFLSYELGMIKPDRIIFDTVCQRLECRPEEALFVDDGMPNVAAARAAGLHAEQVTSPRGILAAVQHHAG